MFTLNRIFKQSIALFTYCTFTQVLDRGIKGLCQTKFDQLKVGSQYLKTKLLNRQSYSFCQEIKSTLLNHLNTIFVIYSKKKKENLSVVHREMKPLATNRRALTCLCICPFDQNTSIWQKVLFVATTWFLFASEFSFLVSSIFFFVKNVSVDLEAGLFAIPQISGSFGVVYLWVVVYIFRKKIDQFLETLDEIYGESK